MIPVSQNKKIAISAISVFVISLTIMLFFLEHRGNDFDNGKTDLLVSDHPAKSGEVVSPQNDVESVYRGYLSDTEEPIVVVDAEGHIKYASEDFCKLLSVKCENLVNNLFFDYVNSKDLSNLVSAHTKIVGSSEKLDGIGPYRMINGDSEVLLLFTAFPIIEDGKVVSIIFSSKDLTEQVEEMQDDDKGGSWLEDIYPKVNEMENDSDVKLVVDKVS